MTTHILCAVDLTHPEDCRAMIAEAGRIAQRDGAALSVMTVLPDYGSSFVGSFFQEGTLSAAAKAAAETLHKMVDDTLPGHGPVQHVVEIGSAYEKVLKTAQDVSADLIIVGAHKPDLQDRIVGPNAARIVRHAEVSVLVVRL